MREDSMSLLPFKSLSLILSLPQFLLSVYLSQLSLSFSPFFIFGFDVNPEFPLWGGKQVMINSFAFILFRTKLKRKRITTITTISCCFYLMLMLQLFLLPPNTFCTLYFIVYLSTIKFTLLIILIIIIIIIISLQ